MLESFYKLLEASYEINAQAMEKKGLVGSNPVSCKMELILTTVQANVLH